VVQKGMENKWKGMESGWNKGVSCWAGESGRRK